MSEPTGTSAEKNLASGHQYPSLYGSDAIRALLKIAKSDGQDSKSLLLFLVLVNAHPKLTAHSRIIENLLVIVDTPPVTDYLSHNPQATGLITKWKLLCQWMVANKSRITSHSALTDFDWQTSVTASAQSHHPLNRNLRGFTRNSVCSCLYNRHESINDYAQIPNADTAAYEYLCLQAQMLVSYMHARICTGQFSKMVRHTGKDECPVSPINPYNACVAIRHLSHNRYKDLVQDLGAQHQLEKFSLIIASITIPPSVSQGLTDKEAKDAIAQTELYVSYLANYFKVFEATLYGQRTRRKRRSASTTRQPRFSGTRTGFIHVGNGIWLDLSEQKDEDNDFSYSPIQNVYISDSNDDPDGRMAEASGLAPDEARTEALRLYHPDEISGAMMQAKYAEMAKMMAAQRFAWDYEVLTTTELRRLWRLINTIINDASSQQVTWNYQTSNRVQCAIIIKIMLLLGQNLETVRNIYPTRLRVTRGDGLYWMPPSGNDSGFWELPSVGPHYRTTLAPATIDLGRNKSEWIRLPDLTGIGVEIQTYLTKTGRTLDRIFTVEPKTAKDGVESILNELKETWKLPFRKGKKHQVDASEQSIQRITQSKIRNVLGTRLRYICRDATFEWITLASSERKGETRMHYTQLSDQQIISSYASAVRSLLKDLGQPHKSASINISGNGMFHGARFVASMSSIRQLVANISVQLTRRPKYDDRSSVIHYHNAYTFYVWLMQSMFTSYRAVNNPNELMNERWSQANARFGSLSDKKNPKLADKARLVLLPKLLTDQLNNYDHHLYKIERKFNLPTRGFPHYRIADDHFYSLDPQGKPKALTRSWAEEFMADLKVPLPGNFHRAFLRTELLDRGCDGQTVDAFLGHFNIGESPFFRYSSLDYQIWKSQLEPMLIDLMKELGFSYHPSLVVAKRT